jgi:hypothetical protein
MKSHLWGYKSCITCTGLFEIARHVRIIFGRKKGSVHSLLISKRNEKTESQLQAATPFKGLAGSARLSADVARSAEITPPIFAAPLKNSSAMQDKT